ncbi:ogr/Delta-like zinc finger family protein [Kushneria indalinina]|uniref:Ogr/Delta-like zinc finger protein n=1 Tax=Kushneria indalinina DSM 14324 TaxID=1122140 RepID=A0A3D9DVU4_9GAMM|nr:Ogr/Delta-like zinc finger protein [Kushneria indalinina DSM 14324]
MSSSWGWTCPHCGGPCRIRTSKQLHSDYRVAYLQCQTPVCGWSGEGEMVVTKTLSPSGMPNSQYEGRLAEHIPYVVVPKPPEDLFRS